MALPPGTIVDNRFTIISVLGEGGMATDYKAEQFGVKREVALKLMHLSLESSAEQRVRFLREAQVLSKMSHPGIVQFLHYGVSQNRPYLVMELCSGRTLRSLLNEMDKLPWERAIALVIQVAEALRYAHNLGVVHRDLTPQNIFVENVDGFERAKLIDFGLATPALSGAETLTQTGAVVGSVRYMSPEQSKGRRAGDKSDVYSLGCIFYEMLTGLPPFDADTAIGLLFKHEHEARPHLNAESIADQIPREMLDAVIAWCMSKSASERPSDQELLAVLRLVAAQEWPAAGTTLASSHRDRASDRSRLVKWWTAVAAGLLIFAAPAAIDWTRPKTSRPATEQRNLSSINELQLKSMSLNELFNLLDQNKLQYTAARAFLRRWSRRHPISDHNAVERHDVALNLGSEYHRHGKPMIAALAFRYSLHAYLKMPKPDVATIIVLLEWLRTSLKQDGAQPAADELLEISATGFPLEDSRLKQDAEGYLTAVQVDLLLHLKRPAMASVYLRRFLCKNPVIDDTYYEHLWSLVVGDYLALRKTGDPLSISCCLRLNHFLSCVPKKHR